MHCVAHNNASEKLISSYPYEKCGNLHALFKGSEYQYFIIDLSVEPLFVSLLVLLAM